jgi:hypothetical protein
MSGRRLVFLNHAADAGAPEDGTDHVILDPAWTPGPGERPDLIPIRPALWAVIRERDVHIESLAALDDWAERADMARRLEIGGSSWWYHVRGFTRLDVHELVLWRHVLDVVAPAGRYARIEAPSDRPHLLSALEAARAGGPVTVEVIEREAMTGAPTFRGGKPSKLGGGRRRPLYRRAASRARRTLRRVLDVPSRARTRLLRERFGHLVRRRPEILAIVRGESFHLVGGPNGGERSDPIVSPVLRSLAGRGRSAAVVVLGSLPDDEAGPGLRDDGPMPMEVVTRLLTDTSERVDDREELSVRLAGIEGVPLPVAGVDLGPALVDVLASLDKWFARQRRELLVAGRLLATLRPRVLVTGWEAARTAWLEAARARGVPTVAIQHGVIYRNSPDYYRRPGPRLVRPTVMCVFGPYERRLLIEECGYPAAGVLATGSPRMNPEAVAAALDPEERAAVRRSLGVADDERLLVISGARHAVGEGLHSTTIYAGLLDGELPGVHIVVKLHPEEEQGEHYPALIAGLARAGGYAPPPVTVVRHVDLYQLLRAADAHLGIYSTVLTDAVMAGTPSMVAVGQAWSDLLQYAAAGVAQPVASVDDVRTFMRDPWRPADAVRRAFIEQHFQPGDGAKRIADLLASLADAPHRPREGVA